MMFEMSSCKPGQIYGLMTQTMIPRPIAWVVSDNGDGGGYNLAPFSYFTGISSNPPLIMLSIGLKKDGSGKDTRVNIQERDNFVLHIPTVDQLAAVEGSAEPLAAGESEVSKLGLPLLDFPGFTLPRLQDCPVAMACSHHQTVQLDGLAQAMIIGRIHSIYVDDDSVIVTEDGRSHVSATKVNPLGRLGASEYMALGEIIRS